MDYRIKDVVRIAAEIAVKYMEMENTAAIVGVNPSAARNFRERAERFALAVEEAARQEGLTCNNLDRHETNL